MAGAAPGPIPDRVDSARAGLVAALAGAAVSTPFPTAGAALWAVSAYLWVRWLGGAKALELPWMWVR